ncbi:MAG: hypothetical protein IPH20_16610 [Bacteroidales bacterium]|nr:hypothetical protein [Bacteroidales bacterium]
MTRQLSAELLLKNISVNAVCPGWVRTDMGGAGAALPVEKGAETPVWLATEAPQYLTGLFSETKNKYPGKNDKKSSPEFIKLSLSGRITIVNADFRPEFDAS